MCVNAELVPCLHPHVRSATETYSLGPHAGDTTSSSSSDSSDDSDEESVSTPPPSLASFGDLWSLMKKVYQETLQAEGQGTLHHSAAGMDGGTACTACTA